MTFSGQTCFSCVDLHQLPVQEEFCGVVQALYAEEFGERGILGVALREYWRLLGAKNG
jgi:hypothetical protein